MIAHSDLAQFALFKNAKTHAELRQIVSNYYKSRKLFTSSKNREIVRNISRMLQGDDTKSNKFGLSRQNEHTVQIQDKLVKLVH